MPKGPYVYERQTEYWTSRQIEEHFLNAGFEVLTFPLTQHSERRLPADFLFFDRGRSKIIGLQYKALWHNGQDHWRLTAHQHEAMKKHYPWVYYAASELRATRDHRNALHHTRFFRPDFDYTEELATGSRPPYYRWGALYQDFIDCKVGCIVKDRTHLQGLLWPYEDERPPFEISEGIPDVFLADLEARHLVHLSPLLRPEQSS